MESILDGADEEVAYTLDKTNGANLLTIAVVHSLDTLNYLLGEFADLSAVSDLRRTLIRGPQPHQRGTELVQRPPGDDGLEPPLQLVLERLGRPCQQSPPGGCELDDL
jgi:hypothetical protein